MRLYGIDFNDGINIALMTKLGIYKVYSNDHKHLGKVDFLNLVFGTEHAFVIKTHIINR